MQHSIPFLAAATFLIALATRTQFATNKIKELIVSETQEAVDQVVEQLGKAKGEIVDAITALEEQVAAGQPVDLTALKSAAQALDDVVPDPAPEVPQEPEVPAVDEPATAEPTEQ